MAGNSTSESGGVIPAPLAVPAPPLTVQELVDEYPEITADLMALNSWRDFGNYDYHSKSFNRIYPSLKPRHMSPW